MDRVEVWGLSFRIWSLELFKPGGDAGVAVAVIGHGGDADFGRRAPHAHYCALRRRIIIHLAPRRLLCLYRSAIVLFAGSVWGAEFRD